VTRPELTDDEWVLIEPFLPMGRFGPYPAHLRPAGVEVEAV